VCIKAVYVLSDINETMEHVFPRDYLEALDRELSNYADSDIVTRDRRKGVTTCSPTIATIGVS